MFPSVSLFPQVGGVEEDPVSIFSSKIGDEDVDFFMRGAWRATLSAATGLRYGPDGEVLFPFGFPGLGNGFFFEQVPELTFSAWLARRWFIEVSVLSRFEDNTILLGYLGKPGEFVQKVLLGNKDTKIGAYDFIDLPDMSTSSLGASALFATGVSTHELLLRYDSTRAAKKVFVGRAETAELQIPPSSFLTGRYFMLPDPNPENLAVYLEDKNGSCAGSDGRRYRAAQTSEIFQDVENGFLYILIEHRGRILVHYTVGADTVGDGPLGNNALPGVAGGYIDPAPAGTKFDWTVTWLGENMAGRQLTVDGRTCLLLWEAGKFSPFEMLSTYDLGNPAPEDVSRVRIRLIPKGSPEGSYALPQPVSYAVTPGRRFFSVFVNANARADFRNHYPFPDPDHQLYGPVLDHIPPFFEYAIFAEAATGVLAYTLEANVLPGSISVKRNGVEETRFTYDPASYSLTFNTPILPFDRIEVTYRVAGSEKNAGDIVLGWGNKFPFSPLASLELALGLRWNILPGAYTERAYSKTGALVFSGSLAGASENFSYRLSAALSYANPDTTGVMRLAGMEGRGTLVEPGEDLSSPASSPTGIVGLGSRGRLLYKDYRQYDALGGASLQAYGWSPPPEQVWSYASGSKPGPYLVAGNSGSGYGTSLVLDFELDNPNDWAGILIPFAYKNGTADLSAVRSVIASLRAVELSVGESFDVYLQFGACAEDIDADGILDEETSILAGGYTFNHGALSLLVGGGPKNDGNGIINSEDSDGSGSLDPEDPNLVWTSAAIPFAADAAWTSYTRTVLDQNRLKKVRALRLIVVNTGAGAVNARLLVDKIQLAGSSFWSNIDAGTYASFTVREVGESLAGVPLLAASFPEVRDTFHADSSTQEALQVSWSGGAGGPGWTVKTALGSGSEGIRYRRLQFYAYRTAGSTGNATFSLRDTAGRGASATFPAASLTEAAWQKITLDLFESRIYINDAEVTPASLTVDSDYASLIFFQFSLAATSASGSLLLDEIHLRDPDGRIGAGAALNLAVSFPGRLASWGDVPVLSDVSLTQKLLARTGGFSTLYSRPQDEASFRSLTNAKMGIFFVGIEAEVLVDGLGESLSFSGGHTLTLPRIAFPLQFQDRYSERTRAGGSEFFRENTIRFALPEAMSAALTQAAFSREGILNQSWTGSLLLDLLKPYTLSFTTAWTQAAGPFSRAETWYVPAWIESFQYLAPWTGSLARERSFKAVLDQSLLTKPIGVKLLWSEAYSSYDLTSAWHRQKDNIDLSLSLPLTVGPLLIEPYYKRSLNVLAGVPEAGDLGRDLAAHFSRYASHSYFFTLAPFYEIISPEANAVFLAMSAGWEQTVYKPETGISLTRPFGSTLADLLLPSSVSFSYGKEYNLQGELFNAYERIALKVLWNSINLFGSQGSLKLTDLYAIDSFATSFRAGFIFREDRRLEADSFGVESAYVFDAPPGNKLAIRNLFSIEQTARLEIADKGGIEYSWQVIPPGGIALPLLPEKTAATGRFVHKESVEFQFASLRDDLSVHPVNVTVKHETAIQYPDFGFLRGEIALGLDNESYPDPAGRKEIWTIGIRLTLELSVKF